MAFLIAIIADHSGSVSFGPGCCIDTGSGSVRICFFSGLVLTTALLSIFQSLFFESLDNVLRVQRVIQGLGSFWGWGLASFWGWGLSLIWLLVTGVVSFSMDWPISTVIMLVHITNSGQGLQTGFDSAFVGFVISLSQLSSSLLYSSIQYLIKGLIPS